MHVAYSSHAECTGITAMARCSPLLNAADFSFHLRSTRRNFSPHSEIAAAALGCANTWNHKSSGTQRKPRRDDTAGYLPPRVHKLTN